MVGTEYIQNYNRETGGSARDLPFQDPSYWLLSNGDPLKKTNYRVCSLHEVEFTEADLNNASFDNCDLFRATFRNTILESADFRTAYNYSIDPEVNRLKKAKFSLAGIVGLLDKYDIEIE